jgi:ParB-like nuclease domain
MAASIPPTSDNRIDSAGSHRIEWMPIGVLRPNPRNARTRSQKQIRQIAASIRKFGFLNPVLVDDTNMVLAGHGRPEAARLEGLHQVPVVRFGHLTSAQKRACLVADRCLSFKINAMTVGRGCERENVA